MKMIFVIACLTLLPARMYGQRINLPLSNGQIVYEGIVTVPDNNITVNKLYREAESWLSDTFTNSKSVILINDTGGKTIIAKREVFFRQPFKSMPPTYLCYTIAIDIRKGACHYKVYNVLYERYGSQVMLSDNYTQYLANDEPTDFLESKRKAAMRYEDKFNFADKTILTSIGSLKTQMSVLTVTADTF